MPVRALGSPKPTARVQKSQGLQKSCQSSVVSCQLSVKGRIRPKFFLNPNRSIPTFPRIAVIF